MKKRLLPLPLLLILLILVETLAAQTPIKQTLPKSRYNKSAVDTAKNTDYSLKGQYSFMLSRSKSLNGYKLINPYRLSTFWQSVADTLRKERVELNKAKAKITEQAQAINNLRTEVSTKETSIANTNDKLNEISFLGISFTKSVYNILVWSIILVLALTLFVIIARSAKNINEAKHRTQLYDEINQEYQNFKAKANEKERKLARELQDERNLIEELRNSGKS